MNDRLLIITRIKKTIECVNKNLENYPKKYIELKKNILDSLFSLLEYCYLANNSFKSNENMCYALAKISIIDYYLKLSYKNDLISKRRYEMLSRHLLEIHKMIYSWKLSNEKKKEFI